MIMPNMETGNNTARAEEFKAQANEAFKAHKYAQAIDLYSQAIELDGENAVYYANRAFAHTKLEEYGSAIQDASKAIEIDPKYSKGYYRRGAAYLAMGKFKEALKDFQQLKRICPNDPDATKKLKECEKAVMKLKFEEAIAVPESERRSVADSIDYHTIGPTPRTSSLLTQMGVVSAAVAIVATAGKLVGTGAAAKVAMVLMVVGACWWNSGLFNRSGNREFNLGLPSKQSPLKFLINDLHYLGKCCRPSSGSTIIIMTMILVIVMLKLPWLLVQWSKD